MRWKLVLLLSLATSGAVAAALVSAQDNLSRGGATGGASLHSRPTAATTLEGNSQPRTTGRASSLAERLQQARQSAVQDYTTDDEAPGLLEPSPDATEAVSETGNTASASGLPSVLKRAPNTIDAPQARTAALDAPKTAPSPVSAAPITPAVEPSTGANEGPELPVGARPLGAPPPGARPLGSPIPAKPATPVEPETLLEPPSLNEEEEGTSAGVPSSRRHSPALTLPTREGQTSPAGASPTPRASTPSFRAGGATTTGRDSVLIGAGPQLRLEAVGPKAVVRGRPASYNLSITNMGEAVARSVQVHIESRQAAELTVGKTTHGNAELHRSPMGGSVLLWTIPELPRGAKAELGLMAVGRETRPFELVASWTCQPQVAGTQIEVLEPQLAMTLSGPKDVMFGETKIYTITLTNPGTGDAENVMLALAPLSSSQEAPTPRNIGTLRAGERKEIPIQLTAREAGMLSIRAVATADDGLRAEAAEQVMVRRAKIEVAIEGPSLKYAGTSAEYRVRVANVGNAPAEDITVLATVPSGVEYTPDNDNGVLQTDGVAWRVGSLAAGDERIITFTCIMHEEGEKRVTVRARGGELAADAAMITQVEALADLKLVVNDPPGAVPVGKEVIYEVRVLNRGTKAASNVEITAFFSEGVEPTAIEGMQGSIAPGQVTAAPAASLAPGAELVLKIKAKADRPGNHIFRAVVQCTNPETRLAAEETTRFFGAAQSDGPSLSQNPAASPYQPLAR